MASYQKLIEKSNPRQEFILQQNISQQSYSH